MEITGCRDPELALRSASSMLAAPMAACSSRPLHALPAIPDVEESIFLDGERKHWAEILTRISGLRSKNRQFTASLTLLS
jgi:hypothetical protein